jgi:hypothetical protein
MANEFDVRCGFSLSKGSQDYRPQPTQFNADQVGVGGPTPGYMIATEDGVDVNLSALTTPGIYRIQNLDATNYVEVGVWDDTARVFYPFHEVLPGESWPGRLSRFIQSEFGGTGTGDTPATTRLRVKGIGGDCPIVIEVFEK